jgi:hypothetical protein
MKSSHKPLDRFNRLIEIKRELAAQSHVSLDNERIVHCAALKLQYEILTEQMIAGDPVVSSELIQLSDTLRELLPPVLDHTLKVAFAYVCTGCGKRSLEPPTDEYTPPDAADEAKQLPAPTPAADVAPAPAAPKPNYASDFDYCRAHSIHSNPLAPLKNGNGSNMGLIK